MRGYYVPQNNTKVSPVVGNDYSSDGNAGFKTEIKTLLESYTNQGYNLMSTDMLSIISDPAKKEVFIADLIESVQSTPSLTAMDAASSPFYNNYGDRLAQLTENSIGTIANESAILGYAPIVSYNPFFIKKQWIDCIFKDVVMAEVPTTPIFNLAVERHYLKDLQGKRYSLPEALYDDDTARLLQGAATGIPAATTAHTLPLKSVGLIDPVYFPGVIKDDPAAELTQGIHISSVTMHDAGDSSAVPARPAADFEVPCNIKIDITTHQFVKGDVTYDVKDDTTGAVLATLTDTLLGRIDFVENTITVVSTSDVVKSIVLSGKLANRFNERSLTTIREVEQIQYVMPESGPRLNAAVTLEDAADALVIQNIDVIADHVNIMGQTLANFEDGDIKTFLADSFDRQTKVTRNPYGYDYSMVESGTFDVLPPDTYAGNQTAWQKDSREYFERVIGQLKKKLNSSELVIVAVAHPNIIRFLQDGINWVFTDDTQISGMKIAYKFGIYTTGQDRVHVVTSMRMKEDDGIRLVVIPLTSELVTFKHFKYNSVIDRNYRNPMHTLVPNIMCTHRTLTFEVLPVQGRLLVTGRGLISPSTYKRPVTP